MTDVNDFYEPGDDREPEPPEPEDGQPLDLDAIDRAYDLALSEDLSGVPEHCREVLASVSDLLAWARGLQEELTSWRALPLRDEYAVTDGAHPEQAAATLAQDVDHAMQLAQRPGRQAWVRSLTMHGWLPLSNEPPF